MNDITGRIKLEGPPEKEDFVYFRVPGKLVTETIEDVLHGIYFNINGQEGEEQKAVKSMLDKCLYEYHTNQKITHIKIKTSDDTSNGYKYVSYKELVRPFLSETQESWAMDEVIIAQEGIEKEIVTTDPEDAEEFKNIIRAQTKEIKNIYGSRSDKHRKEKEELRKYGHYISEQFENIKDEEERKKKIDEYNRRELEKTIKNNREAKKWNEKAERDNKEICGYNRIIDDCNDKAERINNQIERKQRKYEERKKKHPILTLLREIIRGEPQYDYVGYHSDHKEPVKYMPYTRLQLYLYAPRPLQDIDGNIIPVSPEDDFEYSNPEFYVGADSSDGKIVIRRRNEENHPLTELNPLLEDMLKKIYERNGGVFRGFKNEERRQILFLRKQANDVILHRDVEDISVIQAPVIHNEKISYTIANSVEFAKKELETKEEQRKLFIEEKGELEKKLSSMKPLDHDYHTTIQEIDKNARKILEKGKEVDICKENMVRLSKTYKESRKLTEIINYFYLNFLEETHAAYGLDIRALIKNLGLEVLDTYKDVGGAILEGSEVMKEIISAVEDEIDESTDDLYDISQRLHNFYLGEMEVKEEGDNKAENLPSKRRREITRKLFEEEFSDKKPELKATTEEENGG